MKINEETDVKALMPCFEVRIGGLKIVSICRLLAEKRKRRMGPLSEKNEKVRGVRKRCLLSSN